MRHRILDVGLCLLALPILLPLMALIAVATFLDSPGPVLYRAPRIGRDAQPFSMLKFRSMRHGTTGPSVSSADDDRITPLGRWLRRHRLDELPQVFNVLRGEMRLVGPRPEVAEFVAAYPDHYARILSVVPGVTGPTQLAYAHEEELLAGAADRTALYRDGILPLKLESDLRYVERASLRRDAALLGRTLLLPLARAHARSRARTEMQATVSAGLQGTGMLSVLALALALLFAFDAFAG